MQVPFFLFLSFFFSLASMKKWFFKYFSHFIISGSAPPLVLGVRGYGQETGIYLFSDIFLIFFFYFPLFLLFLRFLLNLNFLFFLFFFQVDDGMVLDVCICFPPMLKIDFDVTICGFVFHGTLSHLAFLFGLFPLPSLFSLFF